MSNKHLIYKHTSPSGKSYIGQTSDYNRRNRVHQNKHSGCSAFKNAIQKYGWDSFTHEILADNLTLEQANILEEQYIREHNTLAPFGYNLTTGGDSRLLSEETKQKLAIIAKENMTDKKKEYIRTIRTGTLRNDSTKEKLRMANKGKILSDEHKQKISNTMKGRPAHNKGKPSSNKGRIVSEDVRQTMNKRNIGRRLQVDPITGKRYYVYPSKS